MLLQFIWKATESQRKGENGEHRERVGWEVTRERGV